MSWIILLFYSELSTLHTADENKQTNNNNNNKTNKKTRKQTKMILFCITVAYVYG